MAARPATVSTTSTASVEHTSGFFDGHGGTHLFEQSWRPLNGAPRATFVIMHGLKDHSSRYEELAMKLTDHGVAVYAFDLRGHAHSEGVRVGVDSFEDYVSDLDIFIKRVNAKEHDAPMFLFGHSMGGAIVTLYTLERKPKLAGLVLSGAALHANVDGAKILGTKVVAGISPNAGVFQLDMDKFSRDPKVVSDCKNDLWVYQEGAPAHTANELLNAMDTIDEKMGELFVPLLILHGGADEVTDPNGSRRLYDRTPSSDRTLHIYPNLFHDLVHEPEKAQVMGDILDFTESHIRALESRHTSRGSHDN
jgi:acylglycerol lipase